MRTIVLHATLATAPAWRWKNALLQALPYAKRLQLEALAEQAREPSLAGIALALLGARRLGGAARRPGEMSFPLDGKPAFAQPPHFSISHTGARVCCASSLDAPVGIDLECHVGSRDEAALQKLRRWTALEATLKAAGEGLRESGGVALADDCLAAQLRGVHYHLQSLALEPDCVCHLASTQPVQVEIASIDLAAAAVSALLQHDLGFDPQ